MKKLLQATILITLTFSTFRPLYAQQIVDDSYFSINKEYKLNMPTIGITLSNIPANTGFIADANDELDTFISVFEKDPVSYFFNSTMLSSKNINVRFSLPNEIQEAMHMVISAKSKTMNHEEFYSMYSTKLYPQQKLKLQTNMGLAYGIRTKYDDVTTEIFFIKHKNYYLTFKYDAKNSDFCQSIVKSISAKDFNEDDFEVYRNHLSNNRNDKNAEKREFKEFKGMAEHPTTVSIADLGVKLYIPKNCTYSYRAPSITITENNNECIHDLSITQNDLTYSTGLHLSFRYKGKDIFYQITAKAPSPAERIASASLNRRWIKKFRINIDGVTFHAVMLDSKVIPTIQAYAQLNGFSLGLTFHNVEYDILSVIEEMLGGLSFDSKHIAGLRTTTTPISQLAGIESREIMPLPKVTFAEETISMDKLKAYSLPNLGISFSLPKGSKVTANNEKSDSPIVLDEDFSKSRVVWIPEPFTNSAKVSISLKEDDYTLEKIIADIIIYWSIKESEIVRRGIGLVNNKEWAILEREVRGSNVLYFYTFHNGKQVSLTAVPANAKEVKEYESLLQYFKFE